MVLVKAGDDLLSRYSHYHGPRVLNGRVRDGNGCVHTGMVAGKLKRSPQAGIENGGGKSCVSVGVGGEVNAVKRSAVSTGQLSALLHLHTPPIDLVIFQEPSQQAAGGLISRRVSRLYAFSVYPGRT